MNDLVMFPGSLEQSLTGQQPQAYPFEYPLPHEFHPSNEPASQDIMSSQRPANQPTLLHPLGFSQTSLAPMPQDTLTASVNDAELTATAMSPHPKRRKKKAPTLRAKDWEPYKARILELHDTLKHPLLKVKNTIEEEFGFTAELRQYRTRITQWGKDKNIKPAEMTAIVRKRQQRKLVEVDKGGQIFSVRGRNVEPHKIDRWMVRHEVSQTSLYAPSPVATTPSAIICRTISERGSVALSPTYSTRSPDFSPIGTMSTTPRSRTLSPVTFMPDMGHSQNTVSNIQGHAHAYQPYSTIPLVCQSLASGAIPLEQPPRRWRETEEEGVREALFEAESSFGAYHSQALELRTDLGQLLFDQGRLGRAGEVTRRVVEDCDNNENALIIKFNALQLLSEILYEKGSYHQSQKLQEWLFGWGKVNLGKEHRSVVRSMLGLSWNYVDHGNVKAGEELCAQALKISKQTFGESDIDTLNAMDVLVYTYTKQGRLNEAERLGLQLRTKIMTLLGDGHFITVNCMSKLAFVYTKQGRSGEAAELLRQLLEISVHSLGEDHRITIYGRHNLSVEYKSQGRLEEAQVLGEQVLRSALKVFGKQHSKTVESMALLIEIYEDQGQMSKAEDLKQQRQELERRMLERQEEDVGFDFSFTNFVQTSGF